MVIEELAEPEQRGPGIPVNNYKPSKLEYTSFRKEFLKFGSGGLLYLLGGSALVTTAGFVADYGYDHQVVGDILKVTGSAGIGVLGTAFAGALISIKDYAKDYNRSVHHENVKNGFEEPE